MASIDIKDAVIRLYEDYSLTEGFDEEQAQLINTWAEGQLQQSAETVSDETEFEDRYNDITRILKMVNRFIIKRSEMDETKQRRFMELFIERAEQGKFPVKMSSAPIFYEVVQGLDDLSTIRAFLGFVETGDPNATASPPPPSRTVPYAGLPVTSDDEGHQVSIIDPTNTNTSLRDSVQSKLSALKQQVNDSPLPEDVIEGTAEVIETIEETLLTEGDEKPSDEEKNDDKQSKWGLFNRFKPSSIDDDE